MAILKELKMIFKKLSMILFFLLSSRFIFAAQINYGDIKVKYLYNYDGDTITVNIPDYPPLIGQKISIRINGIDTPEIKGKSEKEKTLDRTAKKLVNSLLKNAKEIELKNMQRGKYFRIVADVYYDKKNLADILIKNNLAVPYDGGTKTKDWSK